MEKPVELLDLVLEHAMRSKRLSWRPSSAGISLESAISELFTWPDTVSPTQRQELNQRVASAFFKVAVIEFRATSHHLAEMLRGDEHNVRHLVVDLHINCLDDRCQSELDWMFAFLDSWKTLYPRLKVCVISFSLQTRLYHQLFSNYPYNMLKRRACTSFAGVGTLQVSLIKFIDAFHERGPGSRKFIRFHEKPLDGLPTSEYTMNAGPLVDVTSTAAMLPGGQNSGMDMTDANAGSNVGEQVLKRAFWPQLMTID